ncbi:aminotransferase class I/II-fold pyridoxal phosphate-dependent enzyme, partial [Desertibacillus haloalkaliphilus]
EQKYIREAFDTNWIAPLGPNVDAFEKEIATYVGVNEAVALSSGTAAIHLALSLLEVTKGDKVFCSSLTFVASANPILYQGAEPVFIDSEPDTWNMSPQALEKAFIDAALTGALPKAVIVVNLYG